MNYKSVIASIVMAVSIPSVASAMPGMKMIGPLKYRKLLLERDRLANCTDFSGTWVGRCSYSDGTSDEGEQTIIKQEDCQYLEINGNLNVVGGSNRAGFTSFVDGQTFDTTFAPSWNSSRTVLVSTVNLSYAGNQRGHVVIIGRNTMALEDGKLHTVHQNMGSVSSNSQDPALLSSDCLYEKK